MNNIKADFSIRDLENLTGIKAHTIRIWEKRYNILNPNRTDTNIRTYGIASLQNLLNISYLNNSGIKISEIAKLKDDERIAKVREIASVNKLENHALNALKMAMMNFDQVLFYNTYNALLENNSFSDIFYQVFLPLLNEIGLLWQTKTITPAHEHFISTLIKQKILLNIEKIQSLEPQPSSQTFVLFLPENEVHDIGLLFINYQLRSKGYHTLFLGESLPLANLQDVLQFFKEITFVSYFTVSPEPEHIDSYLKNFHRMLLKEQNARLFLFGGRLHTFDPSQLPEKVSIYNSIEHFVKDL